MLIWLASCFYCCSYGLLLRLFPLNDFVQSVGRQSSAPVAAATSAANLAEQGTWHELSHIPITLYLSLIYVLTDSLFFQYLLSLLVLYSCPWWNCMPVSACSGAGLVVPCSNYFWHEDPVDPFVEFLFMDLLLTLPCMLTISWLLSLLSCFLWEEEKWNGQEIPEVFLSLKPEFFFVAWCFFSFLWIEL